MWNRIVSRQQENYLNINFEDDALSQQQPLLSNFNDDDQSLDVPYVRRNPLRAIFVIQHTQHVPCS
jgi:hypothetical protein